MNHQHSSYLNIQSGITEVETDQGKFIFHVRINLTKPCSHCGVPACGKQDILWYDKDGKRISVVFDGQEFETRIEDYFNQFIKNVKTASLSTFFKEWNDMTGWEDNWNYNGYNLDADDFLVSMNLLKKAESDLGMSQSELDELIKLGEEARENGEELKIVRG